MITRFGSGWQTITADLALILFLITAQAASQADESEPAPQNERETRDSQVARPAAQSGATLPMPASALAIHRPQSGEAIGDWLNEVVDDERKVATIAVRFAPDSRSQALSEGNRLLGEALAANVKARLVLEPARQDDIVLSIDYLDGSGTGTDIAETR